MEQPPTHTAEPSYLSRPLLSLTLLCCRFPGTVLVMALLLAAASLYWSYEHLGLKMSRLDLINPNSSFNQLWLDYIDEFGDFNEVIVVVEGEGNDEVVAALELLADKIEKFPDHYQGILHESALSAIHRKGLHFVPVKDLQKIYEFVARSPSPPVLPDGAMDELDNPLTILSKSNNLFFRTDQGFIGLVLLRLINIDKTQFSQGTESIEQLRNIVKEVRSEYPALQIGLTGMPILENDEMAVSNQAMFAATILAFVGVCAVFMAGFGSLRHPLLAVIALATAFAWTMGYITLAVGHLNILSIAFGAMLIGLGTDFSVHYLGRYLELRRAGGEVVDSLCESAMLVGPGILTGALTTAAAFYAASFAEFTGVAELGKIVGGGVLCCVLTTFTVFPAMIVLMTPTASGSKVPSYNLYDIRPAIQPFSSFPKTTLLFAAVGLLALSPGIPKVWYDYNLLNLQPEGLESVALEHRLMSLADKGGKNVWFALSIADTQEELLERKKLFEEKYPELQIEEIVSLADPERIRLIRELADLLKIILDQLPPTIDPANANKFKQLQTLHAMAVAEPPTLDDLPKSLVSRFVGQSGKHLMRIYTSANIWDMDEMEQFVVAVRDIDPDATGSPLQTYESSIQLREGFLWAACYALVAVLFFTWMDFHNITASFAALLPMFLGFAMMFGILGWLNLPFNPANMIVLPIIVGVSIDYGIHIIHDFRNHPNKRYVISASTATSILITSLTTIVGFGSMMIASHRGLQSLGRVLVIGMTCCLITSVVVLPAILSLCTRGEKSEAVQKLSSKRKRLIRRD